MNLTIQSSLNIATLNSLRNQSIQSFRGNCEQDNLVLQGIGANPSYIETRESLLKAFSEAFPDFFSHEAHPELRGMLKPYTEALSDRLFYHGTSQKLGKIIEEKGFDMTVPTRVIGICKKELGEAVYLTPSLRSAHDFGSKIVYAKVKVTNPVEVDINKWVAFLDKISIHIDNFAMAHNLREEESAILQNAVIRNLFETLGYDAVYMKDSVSMFKVVQMMADQPQLAIFDPKKIEVVSQNALTKLKDRAVYTGISIKKIGKTILTIFRALPEIMKAIR